MARTMFLRWRSASVACLLAAPLLLMSLSTENSLPADDKSSVAAPAGDLPADLARIPSDGILIVSGRPADLWGSKLLKSAREKYKKEIEEARNEFQQQFGLPLEQVERMTLVLLSPPPWRDEPLLFVHTVESYDRAALLAAFKNVKETKYKGETLHVGDKERAIYPLDDRSLVYGPLTEMRALIDHPKPKTPGNLAGALRLAAGKHAMVQGVNVKVLNDSIGNQLPLLVEPFRPLLEAHSATLTLDLANDARGAVVLTFANESDARAALPPATSGLDLARVGLARAVEELSRQKETRQFAVLLKQLQSSLRNTQVKQTGKTLHASVQVKADLANAGLVLMEAVKKVRANASRAQATNNLKQIALAMHNYHDTNGRFPPHAIYDKNGKPLLSWRVLILPYIEQQSLYKEFHLNEPWDSEHNKKLLDRMPRTYASPQDEKALKEHTTYYQGFVGKNAFFEGKQGIRLPVDIPDGTSNTFMIVEASKAVPWSKPEDISYDPAKPLPKLGLPGVAGFLASMCDGSVRFCSPKISAKTLRLVIERNDGMPIPADF